MRRKRYKFPFSCAGSPVLCRSEWFCSAGAVTNGTVSAYQVRVGERPVCHPASVSSGWGQPRAVSGGVVFPELSKMLHQEDALGAPCLDTVIACSPQARPRGARVLRTGVIRHFDVTLRLATPDIRLASADAFAVVGGGCTGRAHGCKAKQGRRGKDGADVWLLVPQ